MLINKSLSPVGKCAERATGSRWALAGTLVRAIEGADSVGVDTLLGVWCSSWLVTVKGVYVLRLAVCQLV
jgi:hypothetical protein